MITYFKNCSTVEKVMLATVIALFVPMVPAILILVAAVLFAIKKGFVQKAYHNTPYSKFTWIFAILEIIVTIFYRNLLGLGFTFMILIFFALSIVFRENMTEEFFKHMTTLIMILSLVACAIAFVEYLLILRKFNIDQFMIIIFNTPVNRINAVYFNSNYYAMMINFFIGITVYRILKEIEVHGSAKHIVGMICVIIINMFILYLTGCRTAWPALAAGLIVMLFFAGFYKLFAAVIAISGAGAGVLATHPHLISRFSNIKKYIGVRQNIWRVAIANIKAQPLFGEGPFTYYNVYMKYKNSHPTQHSHNIFIDPLLCFGVVGLTIIAPYFVSCFGYTCRLFKAKKNNALVGLIFGLIVMTIIHGFLDYTIFFIHTMMLFFIITTSFDMYKEDIRKKA